MECLLLSQGLLLPDCMHSGAGAILMLWHKPMTIVLTGCMPAAAIWETTEAVWTLCKSRLEQQPRWVALAGSKGLVCDEYAALGKDAHLTSDLQGHATVCVTSKPFPNILLPPAAGRSWG